MLYYILTVISIIVAISLYITTLIVWLKDYKKDSPDMKWALQQFKSAQDYKSRNKSKRHVRDANEGKND